MTTNRHQHLGRTHPLAEVAAGHCTGHVGPRVGGIACGACWELAIRDDERVVVEHDLPRQLPPPDPAFVDEIAAELACRGEPARLTRAERAEATRRLQTRGVPPTEIERRLRGTRRRGTPLRVVA